MLPVEMERALGEAGYAYEKGLSAATNFGKAIDALSAAGRPCGTYVFEFKVGKPAALAMSQIERRNYAAPYVAADKPVWLIGLSFDPATHHLVDHCVERYAE